MGLFHWLLLAFITVPLAELYVLIEVGETIGAPLTIALCVGTALLGSVLIRWQGITTLIRVQGSLQRQEVPAIALLEAAFLLVAGLLLLTPGLLTDIVGFACLVPPLRVTLIRRFLTAYAQPLHPGTGPAGGDQGRIIEGEYRRDDD